MVEDLAPDSTDVAMMLTALLGSVDSLHTKVDSISARLDALEAETRPLIVEGKRIVEEVASKGPMALLSGLAASMRS